MPPQSLLKILHSLGCCDVAVGGLIGEYIGLKNFEIIFCHGKSVQSPSKTKFG